MSQYIFRSVSTALIATIAIASECTPEIASYDDLTSYPTFPGEESSFLSRYLSEEVWNELGDKEDAFGFSFKQAIFSGCKNPDSGVGIYAGSPDSYRAFSSLFTPIINQYHDREEG